MTNPICQACPQSYNTINGRYCNKAHRYVQYNKEPVCITSTKKTAL